MSQINPFQGVLFPNAQPQRVRQRKERPPRRPQEKEPKEHPKEMDEPAVEDGQPPHLDLKA